MNIDNHPLAKLIPTKTHTVLARPQVAAAIISEDGRWMFAGGHEGTLRQWDLGGLPKQQDAQEKKPKGKKSEEEPALPEAHVIPGHQGWVEALATANDQLATTDSWGQLRWWQIGDDQLDLRWAVPEAHDGWIRAVAFSPSGEQVATCGRDRFVRIWNIKDQSSREWQGPHDLYALAFHPDGHLIIGDSRGVIHQWDSDAEQPGRTFDASVLYKYDRIQDVGGVKALAIDATSNTLAAAGAMPSRGATVQGTSTLLLFDLATGKQTKQVEVGAVKDAYIHALQWHPEGFWMAVTCGTPGTGQLVFVRPEDDEPFYRDSKVSNPHSLWYCRQTETLCMTTTNRGSNGNGRRLGKDGEYETNSTPIELMQLPLKLPTDQ